MSRYMNVKAIFKPMCDHVFKAINVGGMLPISCPTFSDKVRLDVFITNKYVIVFVVLFFLSFFIILK
jgi:hypothetical protein